MVQAKKFVLAQKFDGKPKKSDLRLETEELPAIKDGEFLAEAVYLSVDPYMRLFGNMLPLGTTLMGEQVAVVKESKHKDYKVGTHLMLLAGWRTHTICDGKSIVPRPVPQLPDSVPLSVALGAAGMPATTGYFGLVEVGEVKKGDTVFVNGAAGTVGSAVGQIAKAKNCTVVGMAGSDCKCKYLKEELGFDHAINYKTQNLDTALKEAAPEGIDLFYDNVGGDSSLTVFKHMKEKGRIVVAGTMAGYNDKEGPGSNVTGPLPFHDILMKQLSVKGFVLAPPYIDRRADAEKYLSNLIKEGKLKYKEEIFEGFEKLPEAFIAMINGEHIGKTNVRA